MKKIDIFLISLAMISLIGAGIAGYVIGARILTQSPVYHLHDGESVEVVCICAEDTPTPEPTATAISPLPTPTTESPLPTPTPEPTVTITPQPAGVLHGVVRSPDDAWQIISDKLGAGLVEFLVRPTREYSDAVILAALDEAQALGLRVLVHIHDRNTDTDMPWSLSDEEWTITARGEEILRLVADHPALWGVYQLEEPWDDTSDGYVSADDQRRLYTFIKDIADVPLYTDMSTMVRAIDEGYELSDGMCDLCCVAPTRWANGIDSVLARIDAEYAAYQSVMSEARLVFMINIFERGNYQYPTVEELRTARGRMCELGIDHVYYPWYGYYKNLSTATHLWPVIAEGCDGAPPPAPTPTSIPGPTDTPAPTGTPPPAGSIPVMIEVQNYLDYHDELADVGPFYVYGWVVDAQIGDFDTKLADLVGLSGDVNVAKRLLMFSSYGNLAAKVSQIPAGIGVFYNSEPGLSADYDDIFIEGPENSVVKFAQIAEQYGLESHWGPMRRNFEPSVSDHVNDATLAMIFAAGLDGIGLQEQQQIDGICIPNIVWGPNSIGGQPVESVDETVTRLRSIADGQPFEVNVQIMPGYNHTDGCHPGDAYAVANCSLDPAHPVYEHCRQFVAELDAAGLADSISIWASVATERQQLVPLIQALRR